MLRQSRVDPPKIFALPLWRSARLPLGFSSKKPPHSQPNFLEGCQASVAPGGEIFP